jgi:trypsin
MGNSSSGSSTFATQLHVVTVTIMEPKERYSATDVYGGITENVICAGVSNEGKDFCQGVSSGPLAVRGQLVGIVLWGGGCSEALYPGVADRWSFITEQIGVN